MVAVLTAPAVPPRVSSSRLPAVPVSAPLCLVRGEIDLPANPHFVVRTELRPGCHGLRFVDPTFWSAFAAFEEVANGPCRLAAQDLRAPLTSSQLRLALPHPGLALTPLGWLLAQQPTNTPGLLLNNGRPNIFHLTYSSGVASLRWILGGWNLFWHPPRPHTLPTLRWQAGCRVFSLAPA